MMLFMAFHTIILMYFNSLYYIVLIAFTAFSIIYICYLLLKYRYVAFDLYLMMFLSFIVFHGLTMYLFDKNFILSQIYGPVLFFYFYLFGLISNVTTIKRIFL